MTQKKHRKLIFGIIVTLLMLNFITSFPIKASASEVTPESDIEAYATSGNYVEINGRSLFYGEIFTVNDVTYVPLFRFSDWLGNFQYSYDYKTRTATVTGENLKISARDTALYIEANGRYFYTQEQIMLKNGEMYVPIKPLVKALNSYIHYDAKKQAYVVSSGDTRLLKNAPQVYNADDIYWLAKIISAEAEGEPMRGKIAVGNVILNRVRSNQYPNTIYGVIFDKKYGVQFAPTANGRIYKNADAESIIAAKMCYEGYSLSSEILYFLNPSASSSNWIVQNRPFAFSIKNHHFFK